MQDGELLPALPKVNNAIVLQVIGIANMNEG